MHPDLLDYYLRILGVPKKSPSLETLYELVMAHLTRVPFENISKLYYRKQGRRCLPTLEQYLDGVERLHFGGTCYPNNFYLYQLLVSLGYQARLCGADMTNPDVHLVSIVTVEDREYLVDVGYGAPFSTPMPRDLAKDFVIILGRERYVLKPQDELGRSWMEMYRDGVLKHAYLVKPSPREIAEFYQVISESFRDEATFMNALLLARFFPDRSLVIHNLTLIESKGAESRIQTLSGKDELIEVINSEFGIPKDIVQEAMSCLNKLGDAWT